MSPLASTAARRTAEIFAAARGGLRVRLDDRGSADAITFGADLTGQGGAAVMHGREGLAHVDEAGTVRLLVAIGPVARVSTTEAAPVASAAA